MTRANLRLVHDRGSRATYTRAALGKPLARYRWNHAHSAWIRTPMPPPVLENQPELPAMIRPRRLG